MDDVLLGLLPRRRFPLPLRYGASILIVGIAALLTIVSGPALEHYPLLLFFPAVFLCALLFDRGTGVFATVLSAAVAAYLFTEPVASHGGWWHQALPLLIFLLVSFAIAALTEALRTSVHRLAAAERTKALLLEELAHRTKNDLAIIRSALTLQARSSRNPAVQEALQAAVARVAVVAAAQDRLNADAEGGRVDLRDYIDALCKGLGDLLRDVRPIAVRVKTEPLTVNSSTAVTIGLIVNELVTNALKHAFPDDSGGAVDVELTRPAEDSLQIEVRDDGIGCPAEGQGGLGSRLVRLLAQQRGGAVHRESADPGCRVIVTISVEGYAPVA